MGVINFGSLNIDYTYRVDGFVQPGETKAVQVMSINCGGKGLNQSVALARAGVNVYHAGFVGTQGIFLVEKLGTCGVDTRWVRTVEESSGHAVIQVTDEGQNCILVYTGTNGIFTEDYVDQVLNAFGPEDLVLVQNETNLVGSIIRKAKSRGMRVAFNAAPVDGQVTQYPLDLVDWLFVNETEGAAISGEQEYSAITQALRRRLPHTAVVLTVGADGSIYAGPEGTFAVPARQVSAVDTTAAGDTFTGFFLRGILAGEGPEAALELATAASAITVTRPGAADSIPELAEVLAAMG